MSHGKDALSKGMRIEPSKLRESAGWNGPRQLLLCPGLAARWGVLWHPSSRQLTFIISLKVPGGERVKTHTQQLICYQSY